MKVFIRLDSRNIASPLAISSRSSTPVRLRICRVELTASEVADWGISSLISSAVSSIGSSSRDSRKSYTDRRTSFEGLAFSMKNSWM